jgi:hypothetical protein
MTFVLHGENFNDGTFADDMALLANTIEELQLLLNRFCSQVGMEVNVKKMFVVVVSRSKLNNLVRSPLVFH